MFMMLYCIVLSALLLHVSCTSVNNDCPSIDAVGQQRDYYWRDYFDVIPKDAIKGGYTSTGNFTYIGQIATAKDAGFYPANIYPGRSEAVGSFPGGRANISKNVKILCSNSSNKFTWMDTTDTTSHLLTDYYWVLGGSEAGSMETTYVGRAAFEDEVRIGRVFHGQSIHKGLWLHSKGGQQIRFSSFQLLVLPR